MDLGDQGGMGGAVLGVAVEQARRGMQQERQQQAVGFGQVQRAFQSAVGGAGVAERIPGDRLQQVRLGQLVLPGPGPSRPGPGRARRSRPAGSPVASRSAASPMAISPCSRSASLSPSRNCPACPVQPRRTRASSRNPRIQGMR
jgi:hypothetical protein